MNREALGNRFTIGLYGRTNVGKSSLINRIFAREISLVSNLPGTTTDPVYKNIELDNLGPLRFIDTAGLGDLTSLGDLRSRRTYESLEEIDLGIYITDEDIDLEEFTGLREEFLRREIPYLILVNKLDKIAGNKKLEIEKDFRAIGEELIFVSAYGNIGLDQLLNRLRGLVKFKEDNIFTNIIGEKKHILLVVSIDGEYPSGRLILPQSQIIRQALANKNFISVVEEENLETYLEAGNQIDLVVTDSKIFKTVKDKLKDYPLTSVSILMANYKGDINVFLDGVRSLERLKGTKARILVYEVCNHTKNHEDIGTVIIPRLLRKILGEEIEVDFLYSRDFSNFKNYDLVVHCGGCMETRTTMLNKLRLLREENIPIINYGVLLAYGAGILERAVEPLGNKKGQVI